MHYALSRRPCWSFFSFNHFTALVTEIWTRLKEDCMDWIVFQSCLFDESNFLFFWIIWLIIVDICVEVSFCCLLDVASWFVSDWVEFCSSSIEVCKDCILATSDMNWVWDLLLWLRFLASLSGVALQPPQEDPKIILESHFSLTSSHHRYGK